MADDLSRQMRSTLRAIAQRPGNFPAAYPGGIRTVRALLRRGLVRADRVTIDGVAADSIYPTAPGFRIANGGTASSQAPR